MILTSTACRPVASPSTPLPTSWKSFPILSLSLRMFLRTGQEALSETWLYQYFPPPPDKRKYIDDRTMS